MNPEREKRVCSAQRCDRNTTDGGVIKRDCYGFLILNGLCKKGTQNAYANPNGFIFEPIGFGFLNMLPLFFSRCVPILKISW
jgi:hypothetical protein